MGMASPSVVSLLIMALTIGIFALDLVTPLGWADGFLYLFPLILLARSPHHHRLVGFAAMCCGLIILGWLLSPPGGATWPVTYNRSMGIALLWVTALFLRHRKQVEEALQGARDELKGRVQERTESLAQANQALRGQVAERLKVEGVLRESEERFRLIMEHANDAIFFLGLNGVVQWASRGATVLTGRTLNELLGHSITTILAPASAALAEARLAAVRRGESVPAIVEAEILRPDGGSVWLELNATTVAGARELAGRLIVARNVTERKLTEEALKESEARNRAVLESALDSIISIDHQGRVIEFNTAAEATFGYTRESALGRPIAELIIPPSLREQHRRGFARYLATGETSIIGKRLELTAMRADGTEFPAELTVTRVGAGPQPMFTAFLRDITERKRAEAALCDSQMRLQLAVQASNLGPWDWDLRTNTVYLSPEWKRQIGYEEHGIQDRYEEWESRLHPEDRAPTLAALRAYLDGRQPEYAVEFRLRHKDGSYRWIYTRGEVLRGADGKPFRILGCHLDITERKRAEAAVRGSEQRLNQLLDDRERISRDLHDNIIQSIYAIGLGLEECHRLLKKDPKKADLGLGRALGDLNSVIRDVRSYIAWSEPKVSDGRQLKAAIERLARTMEGTNLLHFRLKVDQTAADRLTPEEASHVLYIAREAMSNSLRHSQARDGIVVLEARDGKVCLVVADVGEGFDTTDTGRYGQGLRNMAARAQKLDARLQIISEPGLGVRIMLDVPMVRKRASAGV